MADDEYFRTLSPQPDERRGNDILGRKASSTLMALDAAVESEDEKQMIAAQLSSSEDEEHVRRVPGRQPTIIHRQPRVKSTEGLLSFYTNELPPAGQPTPHTNDTDPHTPDSPSSDAEPVMVQRARSVDLGKHHVRHLSAGSAKLLDIHKQKRMSMNAQNRVSEQD
jgi:hypothetical protein